MKIVYASLVLVLCATVCAGRICFQFEASSYLTFTQNVDVRNSAHYSLSFKTSNQDGTIFFAKGPHGDFERLYISDGVLTYFLFNPTDTGHGSSMGAHSQGYRRVNGQREVITVSDGEWHTVEFFRNVEVRGQSGMKTGMIIDGTHEVVETGYRDDVNIRQPFYVGAHPDHPLAGFSGTVRAVEEKRSGFKFVSDYENEEVTILPNC